MRIITIPDLHGKDYWKRIDFHQYDKAIFLGDYVDSKIHPAKTIIENLNNIISLKKSLPDKIELLIGNHDLHYIFYPKFIASGFDPESQPTLTKLFTQNRHFFKFAFQIQNHLWTHAGVSKGWYQDVLPALVNYQRDFPEATLADSLEELAYTNIHLITQCSALRRGNALFGGIVWADKQETEKDFLLDYHQYVGHTKVPDIIEYGDKNSSIHYLDCLNSTIKFHVIDLKD